MRPLGPQGFSRGLSIPAEPDRKIVRNVVQGGTIESGDHIGHWTAERLATAYVPDRSTAIGLVKDGTIIAGVIYENWNGKSIMAHFVVEGRLTRAYIGAIFHYAFKVCAVRKVICPVSSANTRSRKLVENMGFEQEGELKDCDPQGDILLYTLSVDACRFLGTRYIGQEHTRTASGA